MKTRFFKWAVGILALAATTAYVAFLRAHDQFSTRVGLLNIHTGDYYFKYELADITALQWIVAAVFFIMYGVVDPNRVNARWVRALLVGAATTLSLYFIWVMWIGRTPVFGPEMGMAAAIGALAGWLLTKPDGPGLWLAQLGNLMTRTPTWLILALGFVVGAGVCHVSWITIFHSQTIMTDAQSQFVQARLLTTGHFTHQITQAMRNLIEYPYCYMGVPSYSQFPPGYILMLVPTILLGLPEQIICTICGGALVALTAWLAARLAGKAAGLAAIVLLGGSTFFWIMGGTAMNHIPCAALLVATACCWLPMLEDPNAPMARWRIVAGGFTLGWAVATRPVTGLAHGLVWGAALAIIIIVSLRRSHPDWTRTLPRRILPWAIAGLAIPAAMFMFYNFETTGSPLKMAYSTSNPVCHVLGFRDAGPVAYSRLDAVHHLAASLLTLNNMLFGWVFGSFAALLVWWKRTQLSRGEWVLLGIIVAQLFLYSLYHFFDLYIGPRFFFELIAPLTIFAVLGMAPVLKKGGAATGGTLVLLLVLAAASVGSALQFERNRYDQTASQSARLAAFMKPLEKRTRPTVVVLQPPYCEMIGPWFPAVGSEPPIYFVLKKHEAGARQLPQLRGCDWIEFKAD